MLGSFEISIKQKNNIPSEIVDVFKSATHLLGVRRELMLYLGSQVVHGMNHAYISRSEAVIPDTKPYYELIIINVNEERKTCIVKMETILESSKYPMGGIICSREDEAPIRIIDSIDGNNLLKLFEKGIHNVFGLDYKAELYLGQQIVQGCNYYYIAEASSLKEKTKSIKLVVINLFIDQVKVVEIKDIL